MENEKDTIKRMKLDIYSIAETIRNATNLNEAKAVLFTAAVLRNLPDCSEEIKNYIHNSEVFDTDDECYRCMGSGFIIVYDYNSETKQFDDVEVVCTTCEGSGKIEKSKRKEFFKFWKKYNEK